MSRIKITDKTIFGFIAIVSIGFLVLAFGGRTKIKYDPKSVEKHVCVKLINAVDAYYDEYQKLPLAHTPGPLSTDGSGFMDVILGYDLTANPAGIRFFTGHEAKGSSPAKARNGIYHFTPTHAKLLDPWGNPYRVLLDYDEELIDPTSGKTLYGKRALAWSAGQNGKIHPIATHPDNKDNVYSWR